MKRPALPIPNVITADDNGSPLPVTEWSGQHPETKAALERVLRRRS